MTLVSDIIRDAYRESNLVAIEATPTAAQQVEGLRLLQRLLEGVYGTKEGEELMDLPIGRNGISRPSGFPWYDVAPPATDFFVPPNARLVLNITAPLTVYLNPMPADGERFAVLDKSENLSMNPLTVVANGRTIGGDDSVVFSVNGTNSVYMYRADLGDWTLVSPVIASSEWPFPKAFDDMFVILLAVRLNPRNDILTSSESVSYLKDVMNRFKAKYRQSRQVRSELALTQTPGVGRSRYYEYDGSSAFNSGYPYDMYWRPWW
jgi:hypothetical protein